MKWFCNKKRKVASVNMVIHFWNEWHKYFIKVLKDPHNIKLSLLLSMDRNLYRNLYQREKHEVTTWIIKTLIIEKVYKKRVYCFIVLIKIFSTQKRWWRIFIKLQEWKKIAKHKFYSWFQTNFSSGNFNSKFFLLPKYFVYFAYLVSV